MSNSFLRLLLDEPPLLVLPSLAVAVGLKESIILQQLHYWLENKDSAGNRTAHFVEDQWWVYNSYDKWQRTNFPFFSITTIRRKFDRLEHDLHVVNSKQFGLQRGDGEKWYTINYQELSVLAEQHSNAGRPPVTLHSTEVNVREHPELNTGRPARWQKCPASFLRRTMAEMRQRQKSIPDAAVQGHVAKLLWAEGWTVDQVFEVYDWLHMKDRTVVDSLLTVRKHIGSYFHRRLMHDTKTPAFTLSQAEREASEQCFQTYYDQEATA